jgi:hypothetical protein
MRCGTFAREHGRQADGLLLSGNTQLDRHCNTKQAASLLELAEQHRKWMLAKVRECRSAGLKVNEGEVTRMQRSLASRIRALKQRLSRPCTPKG